MKFKYIPSTWGLNHSQVSFVKDLYIYLSKTNLYRTGGWVHTPTLLVSRSATGGHYEEVWSTAKSGYDAGPKIFAYT